MNMITKLKLLVAFVIVNICAYLMVTGSFKSIFHAPVEGIHIRDKNPQKNINFVQQYVHDPGHIKPPEENLIVNHTDSKTDLIGIEKKKGSNLSVVNTLVKNDDDAGHKDPTNYIVNRNTQNKLVIKENLEDKAKPEINVPNIQLQEFKPDVKLISTLNVDGNKAPVDKNEVHPQTKKETGVFAAISTYMKGDPPSYANPHDFHYVINEPNKCKNEDGSNKDIFFLVLICTVHKNFEARNAIRTSWGSPTEMNGKVIKTMFMLAKKTDERLQNLVLEESAQYHDIIMEDFVDTYKNLTLKTIMGMKWVSTFCPQTKFVMKTDDDMYVSYANIINFVSTSERTNFAMGMVINGAPIRDPKSKWYMPKNLYPGGRYPPFMSGTGYVMSGDVPPKVYATSLNTPYVYLEDVYCAICLEKLHILPQNNKGFNNWRTGYTFCRFKHIMTAHMVTPTEMKRYWNDQKTNKFVC